MTAVLVIDRFSEIIASVPDRFWIALFVLFLGLFAGYLVERINRRLLARAGVPEAIEGTAFERTVREFGTSTVAIIAKLSGYFIIGIAIVVALTVAEIQQIELFWSDVVTFVPQVFVAVLVLIVGIVLGDKVDLYITEKLRGVKLPESGIIPTVAKYSIVFISVLIALGQIGITTLALVVLLAAYAFALVVFTAIATRDLLRSAASGVYLLLNQPYGIGDEVRIGDQQGIVQEVDLFVTHIEADGEEYVVPNHAVFRNGIVRIRD